MKSILLLYNDIVLHLSGKGRHDLNSTPRQYSIEQIGTISIVSILGVCHINNSYALRRARGVMHSIVNVGT